MIGEMAVMDREGDTKIIWDSENEAEAENARRTFEDLKKKGYLAFSVKERGRKGELLREFDPEEGKMILTPPMAGG